MPADNPALPGDVFFDLMAGGYARGHAHALLAVLEARGVDIRAYDTDGLSTAWLVAQCKDVLQLTTWLMRAVTADSLEDVFG
jgi:hypothetical protein